MPLLLVTGLPASGKSSISQRIAAYFKDRGVGDVELINDEVDVNFTRSIYGDFKKEKNTRSAFRSAVQRRLDKKKLLICDSLNHIKGYRYELFCLAKNMETKYAVIHCDTPPGICKWLNCQRPVAQRYPDDVLQGLFGRYERPDTKNRWDSPIFVINMGEQQEYFKPLMEEAQNEDLLGEYINNDNKMVEMDAQNLIEEQMLPQHIALPLEEIYSCIIEGRELVANQCLRPTTQSKSATFLSDLDRQTQILVTKLINAQRTAMPGDKLVILEGDRAQTNKINFVRSRTLPQLNRIRQQFISYIRFHPVDDLKVAEALFVDFLNSNP